MLVKSFFLLLLTLLVTGFEIPENIREAVKELHHHCLEKTGASLEHLHKCSEKEIPGDPDAKCYLACMHGNADVKLDKRVVEIQTVELAINDDIHGLVEHIRKECDDDYFGMCKIVTIYDLN